MMSMSREVAGTRLRRRGGRSLPASDIRMGMDMGMVSGVTVLNGGTLMIEWREDDHVMMTGPATLSFTGEIDLDQYGS